MCHGEGSGKGVERQDHLALYHRQASAYTVNHKQTEGRGDMCHGEGSGKGVEKG